MKALKNESTIFVNQIVDRINSCYENSNPTNMELMDLYSFVGKSICEQGEKAFVVYLAEILSETLPSIKGFSPRNLRRMRDFYITYQTEPMLMKKAKELSWTQNTVILECCENNEQRSFYLALTKKNNLSKLAIIKAIKDDAFENAPAEEIAIEIESDCSTVVADFGSNEDSNTMQPIKNDCRATVPRFEPFLQGSGIPQIKHKAFRYIYLLKVDFCYLKMLYYETVISCIQSLTEIVAYIRQHSPRLCGQPRNLKSGFYLGVFLCLRI